MKKLSLGMIGLIVTNVLALAMTASFYFVGTRVPEEFKNQFAEIVEIQEQGKYEEAIKRFIGLHKRYGVESSNLYYNIGVAYHRLENYGRALQYYLKAHRLKPGGQDVRHNIKTIEKKLNIKTGNALHGYFGPDSNIRRLTGMYSIYGWTVFSVANYWRFCISLVLIVFFGIRRRFFLYLALVLGTIFFIGLFFTGARAYYDINHRYGVVIVPEENAMYEHEERGQTAFTLREGFVVQIVSEWRDWLEVKIGEGQRGWVKREVIGEI